MDRRLRNAPERSKLNLRDARVAIALGCKLGSNHRFARRERLAILQLLKDVLELGLPDLALKIRSGLGCGGFLFHVSH
jgi:hypothetical protein